jgi:hypothetical protein
MNIIAIALGIMATLTGWVYAAAVKSEQVVYLTQHSDDHESRIRAIENSAARIERMETDISWIRKSLETSKP